MRDSKAYKKPTNAVDAAVQETPAKPDQQALNAVESKLTAEQQAKLAGFEKTIETGVGSFVEVGRALKAIDDEKLYETTPDQDFQGYCKARWRMSRQYAYRLIHASEFVGKLKLVDGKNAIKVFPINESQVRPIVEKLKGNQWVSAWRQVLEQVGDEVITAAKVAKVVREKLGQPATPAAQDPNTVNQQPVLNDPLQKIAALVKDARSKTNGATIEFYKATLDKIWGELPPQLDAA